MLEITYIQLLFIYYSVLVYALVAFALSSILFIVSYFSYVTVQDTEYAEKKSPFECGFDSFEDARELFDIRFYLVAILFLIFDLEISYLFPWAVSLDNLGLEGFYSMMLFLYILTIGYAYEWLKGALEWS